jgi:hypothetical protein
VNWLRNVLLGGVTVAALGFTPAARADHWQKSRDGYSYYWSDAAQRWYYQDGNQWQIEQNGQWVNTQAPPQQSSYQSYYYDPGTSYYGGEGYYPSGYYGGSGLYLGVGEGWYGGRGYGERGYGNRGRGYGGGGRGWGGGGRGGRR